MHSTILLLALVSIQTSQFEGPVMVHCQLDTELPLEELRVSVSEKLELDEPIDSDGTVTLARLPEGDLHLSFSRNDDLLGKIRLTSAESGELIRLKIRLVTGNAILLDEFRIKGLSEPTSPLPPSHPLPVESTEPVEPTPPAATGSPPCPAPEGDISRTGIVTRLIDKDSFELQGSDRIPYTVYVGSSTRFQEGSASIARTKLEKGMRIVVRGAVAAGPPDECSIGARQIVLERP